MPPTRFRGLSRLLPLPWAKSTIPWASAGTCRSPSNSTPPMGMVTSRSSVPSRGGIGGLTVALAEQRGDLVVRCLLEIAVPEADGHEVRGRHQAHHLVGLACSSLTVSEGATGTARMMRRAPLARAMAHRRARRRPGGQPVVDDDHRAPLDGDGRPAGPIPS